ncbi:kinesin-like protein KIF13B isoform X3 [Alosa pseudoharengus]|uniref:kinesin-like protein KIF13B isoform X3 n=1 Tax=Alosa pseudoharengus TaxID=34774 RepID=UPI003F8BDBC6
MDESLNDSNVKVAVRLRPMNRREKDLKTKCVVEMEGNQTILHPAMGNMGKGDTRSQPKVFAYDYCFWSMDEADTTKFAGQDVVFQCLGESLLDNAFQGYNACIFAYGQTGSGKSYTMMGSADQPGLIPRLCSSLFERSALEQREGESFTVEVSFMEIYNEKVRDLLDPKGSRQALRVREHNVLGPYVDGLSRLAVASYKDIQSLMSEGNKSRTVAATNMNEESSRSHAVFNIILTHTLKDLQSGTSGEKVSKLSLVDLAGSERAAKTGAAGERLKEGSNINKSLTTLGLVISALADQGAGKNKFVPYRDSVLTWLLKDSLGGNSRTAMVATVSPAADNYEETLSTLRYADRAKSIVNHAVVNEDPNARIIRELREEVEKLRDQLTEAESMKAPELKERLEESEKLIQEMTVTWEDKLRKTEAIAQERQKQLESLGISLQSSGIRVMEDKCFLVNLNADPALNELLVYYLKDHTRVGSANSQDIQLCGMAIQAEHCVINITHDAGVVLSPHKNARTCVNGAPITVPVQIHHGDRILWGNNHFFRINMPKLLSRGTEEEEAGVMKAGLSTEGLDVDVDTVSQGSSDISFNYEYAQTEVMMKALGNNDPMQAVLQTLERRHEEEKRSALERQRQMYEQELQQLRRRLTPEKQPAQTTQPPHHRSTERLSLSGPSASASASASVLSPGAQSRLRQWSEEREAVMTRSLRKLREQIVRANLLVQEASFIAEELNKRTEYRVTLQIPAANLNANRKRDAVLSEPAVQVRRKGKGKQIWAMEKMENRLVDMRELYQEWKDFDEDNPVMRSYFKRADPFFEEQENHSLIGVANVFLSCLFFDVKLQYAVPIINQKGEVAGRLHVEVERVSGDLDESEVGSEEPDRGLTGEGQERQLVCTVRVVQATGLPQHLSNFVFCQYHFWEQEEPVFIAPEVDPSTPHTPSSKEPQCLVVFDSSKELEVAVTDYFLEFLSEGAVAIEVYGHKLAHPRRNLALWDLGVIQAKTRSLRERWSEVLRRLELWVQVLELNEGGEFTPVEVVPAKDVRTGGIFQLRQGQSRRIQVEVRSVQESGTLPLIAETIMSVAVGNVVVRQTRPSKGGESQKGEELDSYQEADLERLRGQWLAALTQRQEYLDQHLQKLVGKPDKSEDDVEREAQLLEWRLTLTEERNAVLVPSAGSGIPGAPAEWSPPPGMETHIPVLFLDLSADDFYDHLTPSLAGGLDAFLSEEDEDEFFDLQIVKHHDVEVKAAASWDPTVHECVELSRGGGAGQRVYLTVRVAVLLSHPAQMQLVLRKRICVSLTGRQGFAQSFLKKMSQRSTIPGCGVTFEIVSNVPGDSQGPEDRDMLVRMAASADNPQSSDSEAAIEKYLRSVLAVENILTLDRLRQEVAVKEHLAAKGKIRRRCLSSPSVNRLSGSRQDLSSFNHDPHIIKNPWESQQDVSALPSPQLKSPTPPNTSLQSSPVTDPVKALVPPVPKMLKSLFPRRDEKKDLRPASLSQQVGTHHRPSVPCCSQQNVPRIIVQSASLDENLGTVKIVPQTPEEEKIPEDPSEPPHEAPSVPVSSPPQMDDAAFSSLDMEPSISEAAVTDISMTTLSGTFSQVKAEASAAEDQSESLEALPPLSSGLEPEEPTPSPVSDVSSGYMSTSISVGTLSEAPISTSDSKSSVADAVWSESFATPTNQDDLEMGTPLSPPIKTADDDTDKDEVEEPQVGHGDKDEQPESLSVSEDQTKTIPLQSSPTQEEPTDVPPVPSPLPSEAETDVTSSLASQEESHTTNLDPSPEEEHPSSLVPAPAETQPSPSSPPSSPPEVPHSGTLQPDPPTVPDTPLEVAQEPSPPTSPAQSQPPALSKDTPTATDSQSPQNAEAGISPSPSQASSLTQQSEAPTQPPSTTKQAPTKAAAIGNPFKIQKIKTSDIKSFKGIVDKSGDQGESGSLLDISDPLERLEIISDTEEGTEEKEGPECPLPDWLKEDVYVTVGTNKHGTVRYVGPTEFAEGTWVGVELDVPAGKNDGSVNGRQYFQCNPGYGVLVRPDRVTRAEGTAKRKRKKRHSTNLSTSTINLSGSSNNLSQSTANLSISSTNLSGSSTRLSASNTNLAALTAMAKREGAGGARRGENRKSWNS